MQGKVRPFNLFSRAIAAVGQGFEETLRNLPARIAASNLRNYALGVKIRYCFNLANADATDPWIMPVRFLLHMLGTISYKDAWGNVIDNLDVDRLYASNIEDRIVNQGKAPLLLQVTLAAQTNVNCYAEVIIPYSASYFNYLRRDGSHYDGMFPASCLGEEASIRFGNVGGTGIVNADPAVTMSAITIRCDVVCCQTKELVPPIPMEIRDAILPATTNPFIETGDSRKYEHMFILAQAIGTAAAPVVLQGALPFGGRNSEILLDCDGHVAYQGPIDTLTRDIENYGPGAAFAYDGAIAFNAGNAAVKQSLLYGEMYSIIDPCAAEKMSNQQACKRLELRGIGPLEQATTIVMSKRRYECPSSLFERWADREGLSAQERLDIRIGGVAASATKLRRSEAIGVTQVVSSRKERKE
jgi:hypothetical protein